MAIHMTALAGTAKRESDTPLPLGYAIGTLGWALSAGVYIAAKWISPEMPPWTLCFWRVFLATLVLLPVVRPHFGAMRDAIATRPLDLLIVGGLGLAICQGMMYVGLRHADAITAGLIMALMPIFTMVIAHFVLRERMTAPQVGGALFAFAGMLVIVAHGRLGSLAALAVNPAELWIVASAVAFGLYAVLLKRAKFETPRLPLLVLLLGAGSITALPFYLFEELTGQRSALTADGLFALFYCAVPGGALMYFLFNWSVEALGAARASMLLYLQTVFVAILAYWLLGEQLKPYHLAGAACIVAGILLASLVGRRKAEPAQ